MPGWNDGAARWPEVAALCARLPRIRRIELIPFHPMGIGKRQRLGLPAGRAGTVPTPAQVQEQLSRLAALGVTATVPN